MIEWNLANPVLLIVYISLSLCGTLGLWILADKFLATIIERMAIKDAKEDEVKNELDDLLNTITGIRSGPHEYRPGKKLKPGELYVDYDTGRFFIDGIKLKPPSSMYKQKSYEDKQCSVKDGYKSIW